MMGLIKMVRLRFQRHFLNKELKQRHRSPQSMNWRDAKSIGVLFDATDLDIRQTALKFKEKLKKEGKKVRLLGFFDGDQNNANFTFAHFNRKQIDWAFRPAAREVQEFIETPFDLLLNIEPITREHTEYIAALSRARLKVGPVADYFDCYDLMIEAADNRNVHAFIQQTEGLLKKTQTRHEAVQV